MDRQNNIATIKHLANAVLPAQSAGGIMPVCRNHCFLRIAYDNAVGQKWNTVVAAPFLHNATDAQLSAALAVLKQMNAEPSTAYSLNNASLQYRQKGHHKNLGQR